MLAQCVSTKRRTCSVLRCDMWMSQGFLRVRGGRRGGGGAKGGEGFMGMSQGFCGGEGGGGGKEGGLRGG